MWIFRSSDELRLKNKLISLGKPLSDYSSIHINSGIKTGYNKAFIIDENTKNNIIKSNYKNNQILKPVLRGKYINKWKIDFKNEYLICSKNGVNVKEEFPDIYNFLNQFKDKLIKRADQGNHYTNLRKCAYYDDFNKNKIIWKEISEEPSFTLDINKYYILNTAYMLTTDKYDIKYLLAILNSKIAKWFFNINSVNLGNKGRRFTKQYVSKLPIIFPSQELVNQIVSKIDTLYSISEDQLMIKKIENEINDILYNVYNLNDDEKQIINQD